MKIFNLWKKLELNDGVKGIIKYIEFMTECTFSSRRTFRAILKNNLKVLYKRAKRVSLVFIYVKILKSLRKISSQDMLI